MTKLIINDRYQLIDLNKDKSLFNIDLTVVTKESERDQEFQACIVSQTQLDNGEEPDFRNFKGKMKVHLKNLDENSNHETQFLCIKKVSGTLEIEYNVVFNDLPEKEEPNIIENYKQPQQEIKIKKTIFSLRNLVILVLVIAIGYFLYTYWTKKSKNKEVLIPKPLEDAKDILKGNEEASILKATEEVSKDILKAAEEVSTTVVTPVTTVVEKVKETIKSPSLNSSQSELDFLSKLKKLQADS